MLIPFLIVFGLAAVGYDYVSTHDGVLETPSRAAPAPSRTAQGYYPYRGKVSTPAVRVVSSKDEYGNLHMEIQE